MDLMDLSYNSSYFLRLRKDDSKFKASLRNLLRSYHKRKFKNIRAMSRHTDIPQACHQKGKAGGSGGQGRSWAHSKFEADLS